MAHAFEKLITAERLCKLGDIGRCELIEGRIVPLEYCSAVHGVLVSFLAARLGSFVDRNTGAVAVAAGFHIRHRPDTVRAPDIAFVSAERLRGSIPAEGYFPGPPDLVVEVVSPDDNLSEENAKAQDWINTGCPLVWVVDSGTETITVHQASGICLRLQRGDTLEGGDVVPGFRLEVQAIFDELA